MADEAPSAPLESSDDTTTQITDPKEGAAAETPTETSKETDKSDVDESELTDAEREHYRPGMSMADVRRAVSEAFRAAKAKEPGLTRAEFEEALDRRFQELRVADEEEEEEIAPAEVAEIEQQIQSVGAEWHRNDQEIKAIERGFGGKQAKHNKLEGRIEATSDPDVVTSLSRQADQVAREIEQDRQEHRRLLAEQRRLATEDRELKQQKARAIKDSQEERDKQRRADAERLGERRAALKKFNDAVIDFQTKEKIPEALRDRFYKFVQGPAVVDLKNRTDKGGTDVAALAREYGQELVALFKEWKKLEAARPGAPAGPGARVVPPKSPAPRPAGLSEPSKLPSKAEAAKAHEEVMARAREFARQRRTAAR